MEANSPTHDRPGRDHHRRVGRYRPCRARSAWGRGVQELGSSSEVRWAGLFGSEDDEDYW